MGYWANMSNWGKFWALVILSFVLVMADPSFSSEDPNAEPGFIGMMGSLTCCISFGFLFMALFASKSEDKQVVVIQQEPPQQIIIQQPVSEPQPQNHPPSPSSSRTAEETQSAADLRKQAHLERAHKLEMQGDLEGAIIAYELAEDFKEAQRVRWALGRSKGEEGNGPGNVNISIGKVGDTSVKDSVVTGSDDEI